MDSCHTKRLFKPPSACRSNDYPPKGIFRVKTVPILAVVLSALVFACAVHPMAAANPAFPADNDTLNYELRGTATVGYYNGSHASYPIEIDMSHKIVNHTGNWYFANMTMTFREPSMMLPPNTTEVKTWMPLVHYYANNGETHRLYTDVDRDNWTDIYDTFMTDLFFIPKQTTPGKILYWTLPGAHSDGWSELGFPVGLGPTYPVGALTLNTMGILMKYHYQYNDTITPSVSTLTLDVAAELDWEWSLGFLTKMDLDVDKTLNPGYSGYHNATTLQVSATFSLVDFNLADLPIPYIPTTTGIPTIPGFPIAAVLVGLLVALVPVIIIRKRRQ
jgi:hypothetical protein